MGMKKSNALMLLSLGMVMGCGNDYYEDPYEKAIKRKLTPEEKEKIKVYKKEIAESKIRQIRGLNEYYYGENVIYARNQKNADRKALNKGYLTPIIKR